MSEEAAPAPAPVVEETPVAPVEEAAPVEEPKVEEPAAPVAEEPKAEEPKEEKKFDLEAAKADKRIMIGAAVVAVLILFMIFGVAPVMTFFIICGLAYVAYIKRDVIQAKSEELKKKIEEKKKAAEEKKEE